MPIIDIEKANCTRLSLLSPVEFKKDDKKLKNNFLINAYTGAIVERWWGELSIDILGIKAKNKIPILKNHNSDKIIGHSDKTTSDGAFIVSGKFSNTTEVAKEVKGLALEGFPWQASIGVRPLQVLELKKGEAGRTNGKIIKGPAEIWTKSEVYETSFVPLGADSNTSIATFSKIVEREQPNIKNKGDIMTKEELKERFPDLLNELFNDGVKSVDATEELKAETDRIMELASVHFGDAGEKFKALVESGVTLTQYKAMQGIMPKAEENKGEEDLKAEILAELKKGNEEDLGVGDNDTKTDTSFMKLWQEIKAEKKCSVEEAIRLASKQSPELYKKHAGGNK